MARAKKQIGPKRVSWSEPEDDRLTKYMTEHEESGGHWAHVPKAAGLQRNPKSCRLRWINYLRPKINKRPFSEDEKATIIKLQKKHGNKWADIARKLERRTEIQVKNFWNCYSKKKLHLKKKLPQEETPGLVAETPLLLQSVATADIFTCAVNDPRHKVLKLHSDASFTGNSQHGHDFQQLEEFLMNDEYDNSFEMIDSLRARELHGQLAECLMNGESASFLRGELLSISTEPVSASPKSPMANLQDPPVLE